MYVLTIWVEELRISERVAKKIIDEHGIYPAQVRAAVVQVDGLEFSWDFDRTRGLRAIVQIRSEERRVGKECRSRWSPYH